MHYLQFYIGLLLINNPENGFVPYLGACRISEVPLSEAYL